MPTSSKPDTGAIHRVLLDSGADPKLIHPAIEEIRHLSGQNVTTAIGAQITDLRSEMQTQITELPRCKLRAPAASSDHRAPLRDASSDQWSPSSNHRAPGGDEFPEQGDLAAHQFAVHSHAGPPLQDPHVVSQADFGRGDENPVGRGRRRHTGVIFHRLPAVKAFNRKPASC